MKIPKCVAFFTFPFQNSRRKAQACLAVILAILITPGVGKAAQPAKRLEFTRMVAHWAGYADPGYLPFIDDVKPEIAQVGFYGAHFWSLAGTTSYGGYPANLPVGGHRECGEWFKRLNIELHKRG